MYSTKNIKPAYSPYRGSMYMILGGFMIILIVFHSPININFSYQIFFSWGLVVSLFGTILPSLLFTAEMPLTGIGWGAVLASVEIPVAVIASTLLLKESVSMLQWMGILLILVAVGLLNIKVKNRKKI